MCVAWELNHARAPCASVSSGGRADWLMTVLLVRGPPNRDRCNRSRAVRTLDRRLRTILGRYQSLTVRTFTSATVGSVAEVNVRTVND